MVLLNNNAPDLPSSKSVHIVALELVCLAIVSLLSVKVLNNNMLCTEKIKSAFVQIDQVMVKDLHC